MAFFSEPLKNYFFIFQGFLTFHSYGQYILYPWGYDKKLPPDYEDLQRVGDIAAQRIKEKQGVKYKVGNSANMLYAAAGKIIFACKTFISMFHLLQIQGNKMEAKSEAFVIYSTFFVHLRTYY